MSADFRGYYATSLFGTSTPRAKVSSATKKTLRFTGCAVAPRSCAATAQSLGLRDAEWRRGATPQRNDQPATTGNNIKNARSPIQLSLQFQQEALGPTGRCPGVGAVSSC